MSLPCVVLASFVGAYQLDGIGDCGGPVEALLERIFDEGSRHHVKIASP
jgi:hypothetical protein